MKHILITTIAAVVLVGCGESQQSAPAPETKPVEPIAEAAKPTTPPKAVSANKGADPARGVKAEPSTVKTPDISIHDAAKDGNIEAVKQHLAAGTDVNAKNKYEQTPFHQAAYWDRKEIVELLLANGADVNAKGYYGRTPLQRAAWEGHKEIVELLIAKGADVNAKIEGGRHKGITPLDSAIRLRHPETADLIRKHGGKTSEELKAEAK
jgi:cytohesin